MWRALGVHETTGSARRRTNKASHQRSIEEPPPQSGRGFSFRGSSSGVVQFCATTCVGAPKLRTLMCRPAAVCMTTWISNRHAIRGWHPDGQGVHNLETGRGCRAASRRLVAATSSRGALVEAELPARGIPGRTSEATGPHSVACNTWGSGCSRSLSDVSPSARAGA
jgi:hypothetical protein